MKSEIASANREWASTLTVDESLAILNEYKKSLPKEIFPAISKLVLISMAENGATTSNIPPVLIHPLFGAIPPQDLRSVQWASELLGRVHNPDHLQEALTLFEGIVAGDADVSKHFVRKLRAVVSMQDAVLEFDGHPCKIYVSTYIKTGNSRFDVRGIAPDGLSTGIRKFPKLALVASQRSA